MKLHYPKVGKGQSIKPMVLTMFAYWAHFSKPSQFEQTYIKLAAGLKLPDRGKIWQVISRLTIIVGSS